MKLNILLLVFIFCAFSQETRFDPTKVQAIFQEYFKSEYLEGNLTTNVVVVVVQNNAIIYNQGFGNINYLGGEPKLPDPLNNLYPLASISKTFTATCVLQLVNFKFVNL